MIRSKIVSAAHPMSASAGISTTSAVWQTGRGPPSARSMIMGRCGQIEPILTHDHGIAQRADTRELPHAEARRLTRPGAHERTSTRSGFRLQIGRSHVVGTLYRIDPVESANHWLSP